MRCTQSRKLFGAYWDGETTHAEREWLESHFASCDRCRAEYEEFSRTLEWVGTLPRAEAAPNLAERVLSRARRSPAAPDRLPGTRIAWVPATAAVALLILAVTTISPWIAARRGERVASTPRVEAPVPQPTLVGDARNEAGTPAKDAVLLASGTPTTVDSLFDSGEGVEFILDPVTLRRGRANVVRQPSGIHVDQAVISF